MKSQSKDLVNAMVWSIIVTVSLMALGLLALV